MRRNRKTLNPNKVNLAIDLAIFLGFLVATAPRFSGLAIHEWLGMAFGAAIVTHLVLHWQWIIQIARRFFGKVTRESRINYVLNTLLFVDVTIIILTGLMISQVALPLFGLQLPRDGFWRRLHSLSSDVAVGLLGLHIALHWRWIASAIGRYVVQPLAGSRGPRQPALPPASSGKEIAL